MHIEYFEDVWDAVEPDKLQAANMRARVDLMIAIQETAKGWHETQVVSARRLGLTQPRLNDLLRGRIEKFSTDALLIHASLAGISARLEVERPTACVGLFVMLSYEDRVTTEKSQFPKTTRLNFCSPSTGAFIILNWAIG
jgi:predicted XRE-type DNA-binding protein